MGLMDDTAILFTTDHGFYFGEHDGLFGKMTRAYPGPIPYYNETDRSRMGWLRSPLFEEVAAIPLTFYVPGAAAGSYSGLTSAVDLMPTVLDVMGLEAPATVEGLSLLPATKDTTTMGREYVITTHPFANPGVIIRSVDGIERTTVGSDTTITTDEWSLLYFPAPGESSLYHLPSDPGQETDVIAQHPDVARELHGKLVEFMNENNLAAEMRDPRLKLEL
jgi:arylsulfatase A-like enzyme